VLHAVSLLGYLSELSHDDIINQAQQVMCCYVMIVLTHWSKLTLLHSFRHEACVENFKSGLC